MAPGADQLRPKIPKLAALMDEAESDVLDNVETFTVPSSAGGTRQIKIINCP